MIVTSSLSFGQKNNRLKLEQFWSRSYFVEQNDENYHSNSEAFLVNSIGLVYDRKLYKWFRLEAGFKYVYSFYNIDFQKFPFVKERKNKLFMFNFPLVLSAEFQKYFYIKGGMTFDFQINKSKKFDDQSGIGGIIGLGGKYDYQDYTFSLGIQYQTRKVLKSFTKLGHYPNYLHQFGVNLSFGYNF